MQPSSSGVRSLRPVSSEPLSAASLVAGSAIAVAAAAGLQNLYKASKTVQRAVAKPVTGHGRRREAALAGLVAAVAPPSLQQVSAEVSAPSVSASSAPAACKIQRVVVDVADEKALQDELKFWTEGCLMKVLGKSKESATVGYVDERESNSFALEIKVDPGLKTRPRPHLLAWPDMQPTVNAFNFVQIGAKESVFTMYEKMNGSGGNVMLGDARYMDVESPRGVQLRYVPSDSSEFQLVSLNIEVPAFVATTKFYERTFGLEEISYTSPVPVGELSVFMKSPAGGVPLLLTPVPDGRIKERDRDEFVNFVFTSPNSQKVADLATAAINLGAEEEKAEEEREKQKLSQRGVQQADYVRQGTASKPAVERVGKQTRVNDGVNNDVIIVDTADLQSA